ncbi:hypothetical protein V8C44DRAFT_352938 [Trichoderma aethiopicum]
MLLSSAGGFNPGLSLFALFLSLLFVVRLSVWANISSLISAFHAIFGTAAPAQRPVNIHVQFRTKLGLYGINGEEKSAINCLECSVPRVQRPDGPGFVYTFDEPEKPPEALTPDVPPRLPSDEIIMTSQGIKTLLIAGISTDHAVSTAVRSALNLALTGKWGGRGNLQDVALLFALDKAEGESELAVDMPRIILVHDATRAFGKGGVDAETVHQVHVESFKEFAQVRSTAEVISAMSQE